MTRGIVLGTVSYNDWTFPGPVVVELSCSPVRDTSNRITKYHQYVVTITTTIVPDDWTGASSLSDFIAYLRNLLMVAGKQLTITGHGFGEDLVLDASNCIGFGPVPRGFRQTILGGNLAAKIQWVCEFNAASCYGVIGRPNSSIAEDNWSVTYSNDERGLTVRTLSGSIEYLSYFQADRQHVTASAEQIIDNINPSLPEGFLRRKLWSITPDKQWLNWTITDTELGTLNVYPANIVHADLEFSMEGSPTADARWVCSLGGTMEVAMGYSKSWALNAFFRIALAKMSQLSGVPSNATSPDTLLQPGQLATPPSSTILIPNFSLRDSLYSQRIDLSMTFVVTARLSDIAQVNGLVGSVGGGQTWTQWQQSPGVRVALSNRGYAKLQLNVANDPVVSLCSGQTPAYAPPSLQAPETPYTQNLFTQTQLTSNKSWLLYQVHIDYHKTPAGILHRPMGQFTDSTTNIGVASDSQGTPTATGAFSATPSSGTAGPSQIYQERGSAEVFVILTGYAIRVGYPIEAGDMACISKINEEDAHVFADHAPQCRRVGLTAEGYPIYKAWWKRTYRVVFSGNATLTPTMSQIPTSQAKWVKWLPQASE